MRWNRLFLCLCTGILLASTAGAAELLGVPRTILVYSGIPRGGSGDIAANWIMAGLLKRLSPRDRILYVVDERASEISWREEELCHGHRISRAAVDIVRDLIPRYRSGASVTVNGVEVVTYHRGLPRGDHMLAFSLRPSSGYPAWLIDSARTTWLFGENAMETPASAFIEGSREIDREWETPRSSAVYVRGSTRVISVSTPPTTRGIFVPPLPASPPLARETLARALPRHESGIGPWARFGRRWVRDTSLEGAEWAVSYSHYGGATQQYVDLVAVLAARGVRRDRPVVLFVKDFPDLDTTRLPGNVRLFRYSALPSEMHESLIAHSDLPPLVTGIASLGHAVQYGKFFFYDAFSPARYTGIPAGLLRDIVSHALGAPGVRDIASTDPVYRTFLHLPTAGTTAAYEMPSREHGRRYGYVFEDLVALAGDEAFATRFREALRIRLPRYSLPLTVLTYLDFADARVSQGTPGSGEAMARELLALDERRATAHAQGWTGCAAHIAAASPGRTGL